jgi:hypothetical protein
LRAGDPVVHRRAVKVIGSSLSDSTAEMRMHSVLPCHTRLITEVIDTLSPHGVARIGRDAQIAGGGYLSFERG